MSRVMPRLRGASALETLVLAAAVFALSLRAILGLGLLGISALSSPLGSESGWGRESQAFVEHRGDKFFLNGKEFRVAGVNNHYLAYGSPREVTAVLDDAVAMNANVVRTIVAPIIGSLDGRVATIWNWRSNADSSNLGVKGAYMAYWDPVARSMAINDRPNGLQKLDFLLDAAAKRHLRLILAFADYWAYTGGARQMSAWYTSKVDDRFFAEDPRTQADYKRLVRAIVTRVNPLTGVAYKDDPTIFAWELMNEPDIHPTPLFRDWVAEMAAYVKSLDPRHMIASGHHSITTRLLELESPDIDFGTWHAYPAYLGISAQQFEALIAQYCALAKAYGKPVILEEFGVAGSDPERPETYRHWLKAIKGNKDCAGWLVWRLVSVQDNNELPYDRDQFDIHRDGGAVWSVLRDAARDISASNLSSKTKGSTP
jgi:mannan endo-1,4-beta-mannosidase